MSETQTRRVREIIEIITLTLLTLFIIRSAVQSFRTDGQSMEPNFHTDEYVPTVSVNNQTIIEPYIRVAFNFDNTSWKLGPKQFFVMGDNRDGSLDSRTWGPLDRSYIIRKGSCRVLAPQRSGAGQHLSRCIYSHTPLVPVLTTRGLT